MRLSFFSYRKAAIFLGMAAFFLFKPPVGYAAPVPVTERAAEEVLVLSVQLGNTELLEALIAYQHHTGVLLPLTDMVDALEFPISVDIDNGRAEGWFLRENRLFLLDMVQGNVVIEGKKKRYDPALVELHADGIYVDAQLLSEWFPVDILPELPRSRVNIVSRESLPLEQRLEREKNRRLPGGRAEEPPLQRVRTPYGFFTVPKIDVNVRYNYLTEDDNFTSVHSASYVGDLFYGTGRLFVSGIEDETINNIRFSLDRVDPERQLTFLNLSDITVGDVFSPAIENFTNSSGGRGISFSNFPLQAVREFDTITLQGDLQTGWEVELYRNDALLDVRTQPDSDGRYIFENVELLFGRNVLKLRFYGPQGQQDEQTRIYTTGAESAPPGESYFSVSAIQDDTALFDFVNDRSDFEDNDPDLGELRFLGEYRYGLTNRLSAGLAFSSTSAEGTRQNVVRSGLTASLGPALTMVNLFTNLDGGATAGEVSTQFRVFNTSVNASYATFGEDFISDALVINGSTDTIEETADASINGTLNPWMLPRLSYGLNADYQKLRSGREILRYAHRVSSTIARISASHTLDGQMQYGENVTRTENLRGSWLLNGRRTVNFITLEDDRPLTVSLRGGFDYAIEPLWEAERVSFTADTFLSDTTGIRASVNRALNNTQETFVTLGMNRDFKHFLLGASAGYSDEGHFTFGLSLSLSADYDKRRNEDPWHVAPRGSAENASLLTRVFLDNDGDRVFTPDIDDPIENAKLRIGGRDDATLSDENGNIFITGFRPHRGVNIALAENTLEDPFQASVSEGVRPEPRPAERMSVDFPVSNTGEIDGYVYILKDGVQTPVNKVALELVDKDGDIAHTQKSSFDGFYVFLRVLPGAYTLRVAQDQIDKFGLDTPEETAIVIEKEGTILNGKDIVLRTE